MGGVRGFKSYRRTKRLIARVLSFLFLCVAGSVAIAADWSIVSTLSQGVDFDDNRSVVPDSPGYVITSTSNLATTIAATAPTHSFSLSHSFDYIAYAGPGASALSNEFNFDDFSMSLSKSRKLTTYGLSASFNREPTSISQFDDTGITTTDADQLTFSASGSMSHQINRNNSVSFDVSATRTDFTRDIDGLTPYFSASSSLTWSHSFNNKMSGNVSSSASYTDFDNDQNTRSIIFSSNVGLSSELSKRWSASASIGARMSRTEEDATMTAPASKTENVGFNGNLSVSYSPTKDTAVSFGLAQSLQPSSSGELRNRTSVNFNAVRTINSLSSFSLSASASVQENASGTGGALRKTLTISPGYTRKLTSKWNSNLGYTFRYSDSGMTTAHSNSVFVSVSRGFTILP